MRLGTENRRQTMILSVVGVLALGACVYLYEELFATGPAPAPQASVVVVSAPAGGAAGAAQGSGQAGGSAAKMVGKTSAALDPTLHMEAMLVSESVEYSGTGRNIFSASSAPVGPIPTAIAAARPKPVVTPPPPPVQAAGPAPPPPIPLKFFGFETSAKGTRQAFLLHDDDVIVASAGDIVMRRYRVTSIDAKSIQVEDMQNNNRQTLPLLTN